MGGESFHLTISFHSMQNCAFSNTERALITMEGALGGGGVLSMRGRGVGGWVLDRKVVNWLSLFLSCCRDCFMLLRCFWRMVNTSPPTCSCVCVCGCAISNCLQCPAAAFPPPHVLWSIAGRTDNDNATNGK